MEKMTNVVALNTAIETLKTIEGYDVEIIEKLGKIKASYEKKSATLRKPTKTQTENESIKAEILEALEEGKNYTVTDIVNLFDNRYSNQKMSALLKALVGSGDLVRTDDKRKAYFSLPTEE